MADSTPGTTQHAQHVLLHSEIERASPSAKNGMTLSRLDMHPVDTSELSSDQPSLEQLSLDQSKESMSGSRFFLANETPWSNCRRTGWKSFNFQSPSDDAPFEGRGLCANGEDSHHAISKQILLSVSRHNDTLEAWGAGVQTPHKVSSAPDECPAGISQRASDQAERGSLSDPPRLTQDQPPSFTPNDISRMPPVLSHSQSTPQRTSQCEFPNNTALSEWPLNKATDPREWNAWDESADRLTLSEWLALKSSMSDMSDASARLATSLGERPRQSAYTPDSLQTRLEWFDEASLALNFLATSSAELPREQEWNAVPRSLSMQREMERRQTSLLWQPASSHIRQPSSLSLNHTNSSIHRNHTIHSSSASIPSQQQSFPGGSHSSIEILKHDNPDVTFMKHDSSAQDMTFMKNMPEVHDAHVLHDVLDVPRRESVGDRLPSLELLTSSFSLASKWTPTYPESAYPASAQLPTPPTQLPPPHTPTLWSNNIAANESIVSSDTYASNPDAVPQPHTHMHYTSNPRILPSKPANSSKSNSQPYSWVDSSDHLSSKHKMSHQDLWDSERRGNKHNDKDDESMVVLANQRKELTGRVFELAKVQSGSRFLQRLLSKSNAEGISFILDEVHSRITQLMVDPYGNYLCQQLFEVCGASQRSAMLETLAPRAIQIACDRRGTHSMQALISLINTHEEAMLLLQEFNQHVLQLSLHPHGTHVLQRALLCFSEPSTNLIFEPIIQSLDTVARNPHGLCVVKKCISAANKSGSHYKSPLLNRLAFTAIGLILSPYGNYAIQHALETWGPEACDPILQQIKTNLVTFSTQKYSSNVVEKSIEVASDSDVREILHQLSQPATVAVLVNSSYGNFVVQKALEKASDAEVHILHSSLLCYRQSLQTSRLPSKWERVLDMITQRLGPQNLDQPPGISNHDFNSSHRSLSRGPLSSATSTTTASPSPKAFQYRQNEITQLPPHQLPPQLPTQYIEYPTSIDNIDSIEVQKRRPRRQRIQR